jgi:hypothetical protein
MYTILMCKKFTVPGINSYFFWSGVGRRRRDGMRRYIYIDLYEGYGLCCRIDVDDINVRCGGDGVGGGGK